MEKWVLKQLQSLPLEVKIQKTLLRLKEYYEHFDGQVYISFSGGKDSTVLLHLARSMYRNIETVFCDTGLEFPEIKEFVKNTENVTWIKPKHSFRQVIDKFGYPVISKVVSNSIEGARKGQKHRLDKLNGTLKDKNGNKSLFNLDKYNFLLNSNLKISDKCCNELKKKPFTIYEKVSGKKPVIGTMAEESITRKMAYLQTGCNTLAGKSISRPLSFWNEKDIWDYIKLYNVPYSKIYDMGYSRTGCIFCMFGCHLDRYPNRFQLLEKTHPQLYKYCFTDWESGGLGLKNVLDYIGVDYSDNQINLFDKECNLV